MATRLRARTDDHVTGIIEAAERKAPEELTEEDKMALLGRPKAGDIVRAQLRIKESKEFKVSSRIVLFYLAFIIYFYALSLLDVNTMRVSNRPSLTQLTIMGIKMQEQWKFVCIFSCIEQWHHLTVSSFHATRLVQFA